MEKDNSLLPLKNVTPILCLENEINSSFMNVYNATLKDKVGQLLCYGTPYLIQDKRLLNEFLLHTGLSLPTNQVNINNLTYLLKSWMCENHKRGLDFLKLLLQCLYPNAHSCYQQWHKISEPYPSALVDINHIPQEERDNYFLTSRISVSITDTEDTGKFLPAYKNALQKMISARFVLDLTLIKSFGGETLKLKMGNVMSVCQQIDFECDIALPKIKRSYQSKPKMASTTTQTIVIDLGNVMK